MSEDHIPGRNAGPPKDPRAKFAIWHPGTETVHLPFIITHHQGGDIVTAVARPKLQMSQGHICALPLGPYDKEYRQKMPVWIATADGLRYANQWAGWQVTFPQQVHVPGMKEPQANPYIEVDRSGAFTKGFARAIGIGRSALTGSLMIIDRPVHISVQSYIEEDLASKAQFHPTSIVWGGADMNPMDAVQDAVAARNAELLEQKQEYEAKKWSTAKLDAQMIHEDAIKAAEGQFKRGLWKFFPLIGDDIGIWVNLSSKVVTRIFQSLVQKRKFGSRLLPSIAERNVLRTALGFYRAPEGIVREVWPEPDARGGFREIPKVLDATWSPAVTVHKMDLREEELYELRRNYLAGVRGGLVGSIELDHEMADGNNENLLTMAPQDALIDENEDGRETIVLESGNEITDEGERQVDERAKLIVEAKKYLAMVSTEAADGARHIYFRGGKDADIRTADLDDLRMFVHRLKQIASEATQEPIADTFFKEKPEGSKKEKPGSEPGGKPEESEG